MCPDCQSLLKTPALTGRHLSARNAQGLAECPVCKTMWRKHSKFPWVQVAEIDLPKRGAAPPEKSRLTFRRTENNTCTDIGFERDDGTYAAVRIADTSDSETIAGQLRVLADQIGRPSPELAPSAIARRRRR